jgi:hypothetical protein
MLSLSDKNVSELQSDGAAEMVAGSLSMESERQHTADTQAVPTSSAQGSRAESGTDAQPVALDAQPAALDLSAEAASSFDAVLQRLSVSTQQILTTAADQARQLGHSEIRPEHILVALLLDQRAAVSRPMLRIAGSSREELARVRETVVERLRSIEPGSGGALRLSEGCKQVLQAAIQDVARLARAGAARVEPIHLLVGLITEGSAIQGTPLATSLALRGLRVAVGTSLWRPGAGNPPGRVGRGLTDVALHDPAPLRFTVASSPLANLGDLAPGGTASRPDAALRAESATRDNVITLRVTDADLAAVDALVDTGAMRTRSEASAWLLQSGIAANQPFFDQIGEIRNEITRLRQEVQRLADEHIGRRDSVAEATA